MKTLETTAAAIPCVEHSSRRTPRVDPDSMLREMGSDGRGVTGRSLQHDIGMAQEH